LVVDPRSSAAGPGFSACCDDTAVRGHRASIKGRGSRSASRKPREHGSTAERGTSYAGRQLEGQCTGASRDEASGGCGCRRSAAAKRPCVSAQVESVAAEPGAEDQTRDRSSTLDPRTSSGGASPRRVPTRPVLPPLRRLRAGAHALPGGAAARRDERRGP
jgi:hypothetical protein